MPASMARLASGWRGSMVAHWQLPYLGLKSLPEELSAWELDFTLSPDELDTVEQRYQGLHRLGAALQLGFLRMTGCTLDAMRLVPPSLLHHLAKQLGIDSPTIASPRALYRRQRTRYEHQSWARRAARFLCDQRAPEARARHALAARSENRGGYGRAH